ncbi:hypothetical protein IJ472_04135, partial [bacterium]|nr:hypothetical protein [bacterium]
MKSSTRISKFKITIITLLITVMIAPILLEPLTVYADDRVVIDAETVADVNIPGSGGKWYSTCAIGAGYKGQGVLIYLLERNGGGPVAGTTPKAYYCKTQMSNYELHAQDKYNRYPEVTTWENGLIPWAGEAATAYGGGLIKNTTSSNLNEIKDWLRTPMGAGTKGIALVQTLWGSAVAQRFTNEEIILVVEPIVANQFCQYRAEDTITYDTIKDETLSNTIKRLRNIRTRITTYPSYDDTGMSSDLADLLDYYIGTYDYYTRPGTYIPGTILIDLHNALQHDIYEDPIYIKQFHLIGDTYAGTPKMVASYFSELQTHKRDLRAGYTISDSGANYYRKGAQIASFIPTGSTVCANANFTLWPHGPNAVKKCHDDATISTYSIGMLAMLAFTPDGSSQTTCNEPEQPAPHDPPNESTGTYTIIKTYRDRNSITNQLVHVDTTHRSNVHNQILIEDE